MALLLPPFPALLAAFYAKYTAATTVGIAFTLLVARLTDALIDPSIGIATDRTRTRWGARKPWIVIGAMISMLAFFVLLMPSSDSGDVRFFFGMLLYYLGFAAMDIPMKAWIGEITTDYQERSRLAAYYTAAFLIGGAVFMALPEIFSHPSVGLTKTSNFDLPTVAILGAIGIVGLPLCVAWSLRAVPQGHVPALPEKHSLGQMLKVISGNRVFWGFLVADGLTQVGFGAFYAVLFVALETYYKLGPQMAIIMLSVTGVQIAAVPVVTWVAARLDKHRTWAWGWILHAALLPVVLVFQPGHFEFGMFVAYCCLLSILQTPPMMLPMSMVNDIADYDCLKTGERRAGMYFSIRMLVFKGTYALGSAVGFAILAWVHYNPKMTDNSPDAVSGLLFSLVAIPALCFFAAGLLLLRYPLHRERYAIVKRRLIQREVRQARLAVGGDV
jgi:Na+/melibiose symporter-like transporter